MVILTCCKLPSLYPPRLWLLHVLYLDQKMIPVILVSLLSLLVVSCSKSEDPVNDAVRELKHRGHSKGFVVFDEPLKNRFVQFSRRNDGEIEFQFPIRTVYLEGGKKPLLFDVVAEVMPTEEIIDTMETLSTTELNRLKELLADRKIDFTESIRGGRDPSDGPTRAFMLQIKGPFDPDSASVRDFVNSVFRHVFQYQEAPAYRITVN